MTARRASKRNGTKDVKAQYDAAGQGRRVKSWQAPSSGPQRAVQGLQTIRNRARDSTRNDWAGESGIQKWTTNLVGFGITPRWLKDAYGPLWEAWCPEADADGVSTAYGMQALGTRAWLADGEAFLRRRSRSLLAPLSAPLQVQLIEADYCPVFDAIAWNGMPQGNVIRQGIEFNKYGRRVAYWMFREHPGDRSMTSLPDALSLVRVAASDISHVFEPTRPGQIRGVSSLAPVLLKMRASMDYEDGTLDRQKLANLFTMFITRAMPQNMDEAMYDPDTGLPKWYDDMNNMLVGLEPGISQELKPGEDVKFANPPDAGSNYTDFMRTTNLGTSAGQGLPYELFSGDILNVSDRTLRIAINEFRRFAQQRQWHVVIPKLCAPMAQWLAEALALAGTIRPSQIEEFASPEWAPHGWEYIHPVQDVEGQLLARDGGITSTSAIISARGDDPRKVLAAIQADKASGLTPEPAAPMAPAAAPPAPSKPQPKAELTMEGIVMAVRAAQPAPVAHQAIDVAALVTACSAAASQAAAAANGPLIEALMALINKPAGATHINVEPAAVNPTPVTVEAPAVTVAAPEVHITNNVPASEVTVNLPDRRTETEVLARDDNGDISKVVHTETTLIQ